MRTKPLFRDRNDAALQLARRLQAYAQQQVLVLAIPRGAVPMAQTIARQLEGQFDVVLVRKLRAPGQPEVAIGAVDETGWTYLSDYARSIDADYLAQETYLQRETLRKRRVQYSAARAPLDPSGRVVIVVDDGLATGATMLAALHALRERKPRRLICAVPVAPPATLEKIKPMADEVVCLHADADFVSVHQYYQAFPQLDDEDIVALLHNAQSPNHPGHAP